MNAKYSKIPLYALLIALSFVFIVPFYWMIISSVKETSEIFSMNPKWLPAVFHFENYPKALEYIDFLKYLKNTLFVTTGVVIGNVLSASMIAYSFTILKWKGQKMSFTLMLMTMFLPPQVTMIPVFIIFRTLGVVDTYVPLILPAFLGTPFFIFLLCQFFKGLPKEIVEAARIDGCSEFQTYYRIIMPLAGPALITVVIFSFMWAWTDFLTPLIYLQDQDKYTISLGLQQFQSSHSVEWPMLMAASTLVTLPVLILFFIAQRAFIEGIVTSGLKE